MTDAAAPSAEAASVTPEAGEGFVLTPHVRRMASRALAYLRAGYPVHFSGPAGTGKTTLALHVAALRARPVTLMHGDDELGSSALVDNRLTLACRNGDTLVYDEFTRSRPEANNALLWVLEERLLTFPTPRGRGTGYLEVHPEFRAIFTSNPEEYAGVHRTQDALMDRLVTIAMDHHDRETEVAITRAKSSIRIDEAEVIVDVVRELRELGLTKQGPSLRACIMIARVTVQQGAHAHAGDETFTEVCHDVLGSFTAKVAQDGGRSVHQTIDDLLARHAWKHLHRSASPARATREQGA